MHVNCRSAKYCLKRRLYPKLRHNYLPNAVRRFLDSPAVPMRGHRLRINGYSDKRRTIFSEPKSRISEKESPPVALTLHLQAIGTAARCAELKISQPV